MPANTPALAATLQALYGEPDVHVVAPAFSDRRVARVLAFAPNVHPIVGALGALAGGLPGILSPAARDSSGIADAIQSLIGTSAGVDILGAWAEVAPFGWGEPYAAALIDAVWRRRCARWAAAALVGPTNDAAALLTWAEDIACAVRRWGQATPDHPTAWMENLPSAERDRLLNALRTSPDDAARYLPWLPGDYASMCAVRIDIPFLVYMFAAYAGASPIARFRHADILAALIRCAQRDHLVALTRLAVASRMDSAWARIVHLLREAPNHADQVVAAAPWNDVRADVQAAILSAAPHNDVCAAIAFARGDRTVPPTITQATARAFFAVVIPAAWDALTEKKKRMRFSRLAGASTHFAVRSPGPEPTFLAHTVPGNDVITAVRIHIHDDAAVHRTLLPVAVRALSPAAIPAITAALPLPPNPAAFVQNAGGIRNMPPALCDWITAHPTPQAHVAAMPLLHAAAQRDVPIERCNALAHAPADRNWKEPNALLAALPDDARSALRPNPDVLGRYLTTTDRLSTFRQALSALAALPPAVALPALHAIAALTQTLTSSDQRHAGACLARALRHHGNSFLTLVDALADTQRTAILPPPRSAPCVAAVRAIAAVDPLVAHRLAHALQSRTLTAVLDALTDAPFDTLTRIWRLLPKALQQSVLGDLHTLASAAATSGHADTLTQALRTWRDDGTPLPLLALRMLINDDAERRTRGAAILTQRIDVAASLLPLLREDLRTTLESAPVIAFAGADLPSPPSASVRRRRRSCGGRVTDDKRHAR